MPIFVRHQEYTPDILQISYNWTPQYRVTTI